MITSEDRIQFLAAVSRRSFRTGYGQLTDSFRRFGRFDRYRLVEDSSPSALSRALKLS
jgi:hypothetical protein